MAPVRKLPQAKRYACVETGLGEWECSELAKVKTCPGAGECSPRFDQSAGFFKGNKVAGTLMVLSGVAV